jgi:hypothetical protein
MEIPDQEPVRKRERADCRVGDWVLASDVPEWKTDCVRQSFAPPTPSNPAGEETAKRARPEQWVFLGSFFLDHSGTPVDIWRRES